MSIIRSGHHGVFVRANKYKAIMGSSREALHNNQSPTIDCIQRKTPNIRHISLQSSHVRNSHPTQSLSVTSSIMHTSSLLMLGVTTLTTLLGRSSALGINCRGSALCDRATMSSSSGKIVQILRDAVWAASESNTTTYGDGAHSSYPSTAPFLALLPVQRERR